MILYIPIQNIYIGFTIIIVIQALCCFIPKKKRFFLFLFLFIFTIKVARILVIPRVEGLNMAQKAETYNKLYQSIIQKDYDGIEPKSEYKKHEIRSKVYDELDALGYK